MKEHLWLDSIYSPIYSLLSYSNCRLQNLVNVRIWISFQGCMGQQIIERPSFDPHRPAISLINPTSLGLSRLITPPFFFFENSSSSYFPSFFSFFLKQHPRDACIFDIPCKWLNKCVLFMYYWCTHAID